MRIMEIVTTKFTVPDPTRNRVSIAFLTVIIHKNKNNRNVVCPLEFRRFRIPILMNYIISPAKTHSSTWAHTFNKRIHTKEPINVPTKPVSLKRLRTYCQNLWDANIASLRMQWIAIGLLLLLEQPAIIHAAHRTPLPHIFNQNYQQLFVNVGITVQPIAASNTNRYEKLA